MIEVVTGAGKNLDCIMVPKVEDAAHPALHRPPPRTARVRVRDRPQDRHRGPDRVGQGHRQPERDRHRDRSHRDADLRPGRLRRQHRRRPAHHRQHRPRLSRRSVALRDLGDRHHRPRTRAAGHRRPLHRHQGHRHLPHPVPPRAAGRVRRQVGAAPRPGRDRQRGVHAHAGSVRRRPPAAGRLPPRHPGRAPRRRHARGPDDRRGLAQDRRRGGHPRRGRRHELSGASA